MYKVILVDDDELVRVGLESLVCFAKKGFQIIDTLSSAKAALESIHKNQPDVVITDMYMPEFNGIQLIREGKQLCPTAIFIVLSCHNNIDFIKEAFRAGAYDYLLKSTIVNPKNAEQLLDKIASACDMRSHLPAATQDAGANFKELLLSYLQGRIISPDTVQQSLYIKGFDVTGSGFYLSGLQFDNYGALRSVVGNEEELLSKLEQYIDGFLSEYGAGFSVYYENGGFLLLQQVKASTLAISPDDRLLSICERLRICIKNQFLHTCSIHVSTQHTLEQLPAAVQALLSSMAGPLHADSIVRVAPEPPEACSAGERNAPPDPIESVIRYIEENYTSAITLDELANIANFSKYHLCRKFKDVMHMGIINYILMLRIDKAKELLLESDCGYIFEIAEKVGFNDTSYFNRTFKRITGYTPNEFQRMNSK